MLALTIGFIYYLILNKAMLPLLRQPFVQSLFVGATLVVTTLWSIQAKLHEMPPLHFLAVTSLILLLGLRLSLLVMPLAIYLPITAAYWLQAAPWPPIDETLMRWLALLSAALQSYLVYWWSEQRLSSHLFVRIFVCGFFNAMLSAVVYMSVLAGGHVILGLSTTQLATDYLTTMPLLALPEALLNGMAITMLLIYRPHWLAAFRDNQ
jgi:uncharacterized membrane protein